MMDISRGWHADDASTLIAIHCLLYSFDNQMAANTNRSGRNHSSQH